MSFRVDGDDIYLTRGDTASLLVIPEGYHFGSDDRAVFTIRTFDRDVVMERQYQVSDEGFVISFSNSDTDWLPAGEYNWDIRYVVDPQYDDAGRIVNGSIVSTPQTPCKFFLEEAQGEV